MRPVKAVVVACGTLLAFPALSAAHGVRVAHAAAATPTQTITVGSAPWGVAADPNSGMVYVSNYNSDTLSVIDEATDKVTATIPVGPAPEAVAVNPTTDTVYVANFGGESVSVINASTDAVTDTIDDVGLNPNSIAVDAATNTVYVGTYMSSTVDVINGATNAITTEIPLPDANIHDVVVDPSTDIVYATAYNLGYVAVISTTTNTVIGELTGMCGPDGLAIDASTNTLSVVQNYCDYGVVTYSGAVISSSGGVITAFAPSKNAPNFMTQLPGGDAFASVGAASPASDGTVETIAKGRIVGPAVRVGPNPRMLDADPITGKVFVANYGSDTVTEFEG
jgi:YVTN family beta-propeller protein